MSPSLDDMELTAAPYLGKGPGEEGADVNRRCDHGYNEAFAFCGGGPLRNYFDGSHVSNSISNPSVIEAS